MVMSDADPTAKSAAAESGRQDLAALIRLAQAAKRPPVDAWDPPHCGHSRMQILSDGSWLHEGRAITRPALVRLFASILRREPDGGFVLVTPVEKLDIEVDDAPFVAIELISEGTGGERILAFRLNTDEIVPAGPAHRLRIEERDGGPRPYLEVRKGLDALLARPVYYALAELALDEGGSEPGLWSGGTFISLATAS